MAWLSPAYPVGAFSYSSGIEWAVECGDIANAATLKEWLAIPSISADPGHHGDVRSSAQWLAAHFTATGFPTVEIWETGPASSPGQPAVFAHWPARDPAAPTVLVYGHHDVQPVEPLGEWHSPPFEPAERDGQLLGRGASDDKG